MPIYHFELETRVPSQVALDRIKELVGPQRPFFAGIRYGFGFGFGTDASPPFIGKVEADSFRIRHDIRYRNSFLPLIWGRVTGIPVGSRVSVTMFLHPVIALFMLLWFWGVGAGVVGFLDSARPEGHWLTLVPIGLLVFGVAVLCRGFFPEAIEARRLLEQALSRSHVQR